MTRGYARLALLACALLSCDEEPPPTQVMVVIDAESSVRSRVIDVDVVVKSGEGDVSTWSPRYEMSLTQGSGPVAWPLELALVPRDGNTRRNYLVVATAHDERGWVLAEVRAISGYVEGKSLSLPLVFDAACLARETRCNEDRTCRAGQCVDPYVEPSALLPFQPGLRPGDGLPEGGAGGSSGAGGNGGAGGSETDGAVGGDGAVDACEEPPCIVEPMIDCTDERCAGCPENFLRLDDDRCTPLLIGLGLSKGQLATMLDTESVRYQIAVPLLTDEVTFTPLAAESAELEINGEPLDEGSYTASSLPIGESTFVITLRAAGHDSRTYTFTLTRGGAQRSFIKAPNTGEGDAFGESLAVQGDTLVIGAPREDSSSRAWEADDDLREDSGAAYVMVRSGASFEHSAYLKAEEIRAGALFGDEVAIDGDTIAVSASAEAGGGAVYVFRRDGERWPLEQRLALASSSGRKLGAALALEGDLLAVGAPEDDAFASDGGAVYVFTRSGTSWTASAAIGPETPAGSAWFGSSVELHGGVLAAGATGESTASITNGVVYVFERVSDGYEQRQRLLAPEPGPLDFFGESIQVDGETMAIGAPGASSGAAGNGLIYVYTLSSEGWTLEQRIGPSIASVEANLARRLVLFGDVIISGAPFDDSGRIGVGGVPSADGIIDSGAGYVFLRSGTRWSELALIKAEPPETADTYGYSVAAEGDSIFIGAPGESSSATGVDGDATVDGATGSGAVYVVR